MTLMSSDAPMMHLAIPSHDLELALDFYVNGLGCRLGRRRQDSIILDFYGMQLVCHLSEEINPEPKMYPRHFGIILTDKSRFDTILSLAESRKLPFFQQPFRRFPDQPEAHETFFLCDPSHNLIEFKYYQDPAMIY